MLALTLLVAGCASAPEPEVVTVQHHQRQTQVVAEKRTQAPPTLRIVGETTRTQAPPPQPRPVARQNQASPPPAQLYFLQVGPPLVLNTQPTPVPPPVYQAPPQPVPAPSLTPPAPVVETAPSFTYQDGGVNGTTAPLSTPSPSLPTAEGFQYQP